MVGTSARGWFQSWQTAALLTGHGIYLASGGCIKQDHLKQH